MCEEAGLRLSAEGEVEMSTEVAVELVKQAACWTVSNPKLAAMVAVVCYPAYARMAAARHRKMRIMTIIGMSLDYIGDQIYERLREDYGPSDEEVAEETLQSKRKEHGPN